MSIIRLPIDAKSLYFNIKNDNKTGHTATVATPLKQGASIRRELSQITQIPENINSISREVLVSQLLSKSRADAKINNVFVFDRISVNGKPLENIPSFCMYIREETSPTNVHCGRQKLHYPPSLTFEDLDVTINNRIVTRAISEALCDYAFLVEAFEYDADTGILNFDAVIVGENDIPYSKVFINRRGVGNKFTLQFSENSNLYDSEIIALREAIGYDAVTPDNFNDVMAENSRKAQMIAIEHVNNLGGQVPRLLIESYPYAIYDIAYKFGSETHYLLVKHTATKSKYFSLPLSKIRFLNDFAASATLLLITDINGTPKLHTYSIADINRMSKSINSITYKDTDCYE